MEDEASIAGFGAEPSLPISRSFLQPPDLGHCTLLGFTLSYKAHVLTQGENFPLLAVQCQGPNLGVAF